MPAPKMPAPRMPAMDELRVERVLRAVEAIPPGRIAAYGDVARIVGTGPRVVGAVMARHGGSVPWWRVTNAAGDLPPHLAARALPHWREEGIAMKPDGRGCRIRVARADLVALAAAWRDAVADLPQAPRPAR